jgi:ATP-dependent Clp protease, protease subunit
MPLIPYIIEQTSRGERSYDVFSRLLRDRIIFVSDAINDEYANLLIAQLLFLEADNPERDIYLYINSPGGYIPSGLAIYDTMQLIKPEVRTLCIGQASSVSSLLLTGGTKGKRTALPNSRVIMRQTYGRATGQASDIELESNEIERTNRIIVDLYHKHTSKPKEVIQKDIERVFYMTAQEAKDYGLIDNVMIDRKSSLLESK